jgi:hypothetical protein
VRIIKKRNNAAEKTRNVPTTAYSIGHLVLRYAYRPDVAGAAAGQQPFGHDQVGRSTDLSDGQGSGVALSPDQAHDLTRPGEPSKITLGRVERAATLSADGSSA